MLGAFGPIRRYLVVTLFAISALLFLAAYRKYQPHRQDRLLSAAPDGIRGSVPASSDAADISALCRKHGYKPYRPSGNRRRKVYDLFLMSHELDWLEIRLNTLASYVDYFVIVESPTTFTGLEKPLYLQDNWSNFSQFHEKIVHRVVEDPGSSIGTSTWMHEDYMRNSLFHSAFPTLVESEQEAQEGDVILVSDVDEIPKPETLDVLRHCEFPDRLTLRSSFYYYSFQWLHVGEQWPHPQATVFHGLSDTLSPNYLRNGIGGPSSYWPFVSSWRRWRQKADMWDAAWHCSSCFATLAEMRAKMRGFSHTPLNTPENRDEATMMQRVRTGQDMFGRTSEQYRRIEENQDVPQYVLQKKEQYSYMLDRDGENAGFRDWHLPEKG